MWTNCNINETLNSSSRTHSWNTRKKQTVLNSEFHNFRLFWHKNRCSIHAIFIALFSSKSSTKIRRTQWDSQPNFAKNCSNADATSQSQKCVHVTIYQGVPVVTAEYFSRLVQERYFLKFPFLRFRQVYRCLSKLKWFFVLQVRKRRNAVILAQFFTILIGRRTAETVHQPHKCQKDLFLPRCSYHLSDNVLSVRFKCRLNRSDALVKNEKVRPCKPLTFLSHICLPGRDRFLLGVSPQHHDWRP